MKRVLITRPEPGAAETADRLKALGLFPVVAPVFSIITRKVRAPEHVAATLLTSRNAISACPEALLGRPIFAVGTATAQVALRAGFTRVYDANGTAEALVDLVVSTLSAADGSLFLPTAEGQGTDLAASLRRHGFRVVRRVAYKSAAISALPETTTICLRQGRITAALFFSGETSRHFVHLVQAAELTETLRHVEAVSISESAAVALRGLPWRRIKVAAKPNQDAMLVLLK